MTPVEAPSAAEIAAARERLARVVVPTPLVPLQLDDGADEVFLKLESLQPIGSFKLRGAANAMADGWPAGEAVYTASAGNMAQGVAWNARRLGVPCRVLVPDHAPETKLAAVRRLGGEIVRLPFEEWWGVLVEGRHSLGRGRFVHPVSDPRVIAGNATIGLEIAQALPDVGTVIVPYGGGGLACGIAAALREAAPGARVVACEVETAAPLAAALAAGEPRTIDYTASFVDGIGSREVLPEMWPLARSLVVDSAVVSLEEVAGAIRWLAERHRIIAEGAGATSVAAALAGHLGGKTVCIVSGGNLDAAKLCAILDGRMPAAG